METERRTFYNMVMMSRVGVATFGYIGSDDREFLLTVLEGRCEDLVVWKVEKVPREGIVASLYTFGDKYRVLRELDRLVDTFHALHHRTLLSICFSGNPDPPVVET